MKHELFGGCILPGYYLFDFFLTEAQRHGDTETGLELSVNRLKEAVLFLCVFVAP